MARRYGSLLRSIGRRIRAAITLERIGAGAILASFLIVRAVDPPLLEVARTKFFDFYWMIQPSQNKQRPIVIVDIDEKSIARLGQFPWPRTRLAKLVEKLREAGAVAIAFDIMFPERDRLSPAVYANSTDDLAPEVKKTLESLPDNDAVFARSITNMAVVLGEAVLPRPPPGQSAEVKRTPIAIIGPNPAPYLLRAPALLRNIPVLERAASGVGVLTHYPEFDGVVRRLPIGFQYKNQIKLPLALELLRVATGGNAAAIRSDDNGIVGIVLAGQLIPTDKRGRIWVNFSHHDPNRYVSFVDVLEGRVPAERLRGRLVLVGTSAAGLLDLKATPLERSMPGVEVHAMLLENILFKDYIQRPSYTDAVEFYTAFMLSFLMIMFLPRLGPTRTMLVGFVVVGTMLGAALYMFLEEKILFDLTFTAATSFVVFLILAGFNYMRESQSKNSIRRAFSRYMSPALVEQLVDRPDRLVLGGQMRELSILFTDIRGFTTVSENMDAEELTAFINRFLTPMSDVIMQNSGTIDKYIGDSIMAFWNAPLDDPKHAEHACRAAFGMRAALVTLNEELAAEGNDKQIRIGIGINTGICCVGNMGSDQRFDYSALGDAVNVASRIEGSTKEFGTDIIIGENTAKGLPGFAMLGLGDVSVRGRSQQAQLFALIGDEETAADPIFEEWIEIHDTLHKRIADGDAQPKEILHLIERCRQRANGQLDAYYDRLAAEAAPQTEAAQ